MGEKLSHADLVRWFRDVEFAGYTEDELVNAYNALVGGTATVVGQITPEDIARAREALYQIIGAVRFMQSGVRHPTNDRVFDAASAGVAAFLDRLTPGPVEVANLQGERREFEFGWSQNSGRVVARWLNPELGWTSFDYTEYGRWIRASVAPAIPDEIRAPLLAALRQWLADQIKVEE